MSKKSLDGLARRQHGLFTGAQARQVGLTARQLEHGLVTGRWERPFRNVYRPAGAPVTDLQRLLAAVLACGPGAVASHRGAAWLWGLGDTLRLEVSGTRQRAPGPGVTVFRRPVADLRPVVRRGVPATNPLRTVVDVAADDDRSTVEAALDRGIAGGLFTVVAVEAELGRRAASGRQGVTLLRACLAERLDRGGGRTSCLESRPGSLNAACDCRPEFFVRWTTPGVGKRAEKP